VCVGAINVTYRAEAGNVTELSSSVSLATPGVDFSPEEQSVVLGDGEESAVINVAISNVSKGLSQVSAD
jgi:hypothetical protein